MDDLTSVVGEDLSPSECVQRQVQDNWSYGTQPNLSMGAMERLIVALQPVDEQRQLLSHIQSTTAVPEQAINRARQEIQLLREYRTRLIADVVTGKLDVREAGARLPPATSEPEEGEMEDVLASDERGSETTDSADEEAARTWVANRDVAFVGFKLQ